MLDFVSSTKFNVLIKILIAYKVSDLDTSLHDVLYILGFPTNLLSINTITHNLNYVAISFSFYCIF